ncbi:unnamed protein product [Cuscuta europaea]|uniref:Transposase (putative) gypsy type domain-containing protein n=1 Tax=Cuscuta europaea TaxID=41803 RepID=A0A9P1E3P3_CUSEU|nr:unnamed protein product [Cuscuta europaea]
MSSQSDSQDISGEPSVEMETCSDVESSSVESSAGGDAAVAMEVEKDLQAEAEAEGFEQENEDEELALAVQTAEQEEERERLKVTVAIPPPPPPPRGAGEASSSRPLDPTPISVAPGKKNKMKAAPRKKQAAVDAGRPVGIPEGHSFLNTAALELKTRASPAEYQSTEMLVGPSARVVEPRADDLLRYAPEGCFAAHTLSVEMGLRFPLHPFLLEYLRFVGLALCQLTPNSHSYVAGFLSLCQSRGVEPTLDQFFMSFNLCRGDIQMLRALPTFSRYRSSGFLMMCPRPTRGGRRGSATFASKRTPSRPNSAIASGAIRRWGAQLWRRMAKCLPGSRRGLTSTSRS